MKKIAALFLFSFMTLAASAQFKVFSPDINWGIKAGLNMADISRLGVDMKPSFHAGGFFEYRFSPKWSVLSEMVYSRQGSYEKLEVDMPTPGHYPPVPGIGTRHETYKIWQRSNYLNIPVLIKHYIIPNKLSVGIGPQLGIGLGHALKIEADGEKDVMKLDNSLFNAVDFSVAIGAAYNFNDYIFASLRYNFGITDMMKNIEGTNQVLQFSVGINFSGDNSYRYY